MKLGFFDLLDTKGMNEDDVKRLKQMDEVLGEAFSKKMAAFKDEELDKTIADVMNSVKALESAKTHAIDEKKFNEVINSVNEELLRLKAMAEEKREGSKFPSIEEQISVALKDYITIDKKGVKSFDIRKACLDAPGNKKTINLFVEKAATISTTGKAPHFYHAIDNVLSVDPRAETIIRQHSNVAKIDARTLTYAQVKFNEGDAAWTLEGATKAMMDGDIEEVTIHAGKVTLGAKLTEETLSDFPQLVAEIRAEIINRIGLAEENGILNGSGAGGEIKGVASEMPAFGLSSFKVASPSYVDAIVAAYTQIVTNSNNAYKPNLVLMNPTDYWLMMREKDASGRPLNENLNNILPNGMKIVASTAIAQGDFYVGDFNFLNIRDVWELSITFGWENDDFTKNLVTMLGEKRLMTYIKSQYKTAFVKDKFSTVIEAIKKA